MYDLLSKLASTASPSRGKSTLLLACYTLAHASKFIVPAPSASSTTLSTHSPTSLSKPRRQESPPRSQHQQRHSEVRRAQRNQALHNLFKRRIGGNLYLVAADSTCFRKCDFASSGEGLPLTYLLSTKQQPTVIG
jgi:hypothetical protein